MHLEWFHERIPSMTKEIEATLVVVHDDPLGFMESISALRSLGPYRINPGEVLSLKDTYYDTPSGLLSNRGIAVRTREHGVSQIFCIKQDEQVDGEGTAIRDEIEMPWSRQCVDHMAHILHKLSSGLNEVPPRTGSPSECLACLGLITVQERETTRMLLNVSLPEGPHPGTVAEMALDRVCYVLSGARILHYEVEIEATMAEVPDHIRGITSLLCGRYGEILRPWRHNKLVTGFALEQLIADYRLYIQPGRYTHLTGKDYAAIEAVLKDF